MLSRRYLNRLSGRCRPVCQASFLSSLLFFSSSVHINAPTTYIRDMLVNSSKKKKRTKGVFGRRTYSERTKARKNKIKQSSDETKIAFVPSVCIDYAIYEPLFHRLHYLRIWYMGLGSANSRCKHSNRVGKSFGSSLLIYLFLVIPVHGIKCLRANIQRYRVPLCNTIVYREILASAN